MIALKEEAVLNFERRRQSEDPNIYFEYMVSHKASFSDTKQKGFQLCATSKHTATDTENKRISGMDFRHSSKTSNMCWYSKWRQTTVEEKFKQLLACQSSFPIPRRKHGYLIGVITNASHYEWCYHLLFGLGVEVGLAAQGSLWSDEKAIHKTFISDVFSSEKRVGDVWTSGSPSHPDVSQKNMMICWTCLLRAVMIDVELPMWLWSPTIFRDLFTGDVLAKHCINSLVKAEVLAAGGALFGVWVHRRHKLWTPHQV